MSRRAIDRAGWSPEERDEYDSLLAEVVASSTDTTERLDTFEVRLADAVQAHRPWAVEVERACRRQGMGKEIARYQDRSRAVVAHDGRVLSLPAIQARRVVDTDQVLSYQRELIELWTWEQIVDKRVEALKTIGAYTDRVAHYDRLLALRVLAPESTSPANAAEHLGIDLDEFLGQSRAA